MTLGQSNVLQSNDRFVQLRRSAKQFRQSVFYATTPVEYHLWIDQLLHIRTVGITLYGDVIVENRVGGSEREKHIVLGGSTVEAQWIVAHADVGRRSVDVRKDSFVANRSNAQIDQTTTVVVFGLGA